MDRVVILGVPVDAVTKAEAVERICAMLHGDMQRHVMTPNNEMLVHASKDPAFRSLLNRTALNLPDSTGVLWAAKWTDQALPERVTGVDTVEALCSRLQQESVFLLGAAEGVAEKAALALRSRNPNLNIVGTFAGSPKESDAPGIIERVNASGASLLLVAYGAPAQDLWIDEYLSKMPSVRVAMGVGGTFDFLAGTQKRAPAWMRSIGLEWLYRFMKQPSRWKRMWTAVVVFPFLVIIRGATPPR